MGACLLEFLFCINFFKGGGFLCITVLADLEPALYRPGWPQSLRDPPASASQVLELKVYATIPAILPPILPPTHTQINMRLLR